MKHRRGLLAIIAAVACAIGIGVFGLIAVLTPPAPSSETPVVETGTTTGDGARLEFLYIDKNAVSAGDEQAIAVAFDEGTSPSASTIQLTHRSTGTARSFSASTLDDHAALFTFPASELASGTWDVTDVQGDEAGAPFTIPVVDDESAGSHRFDVVEASLPAVADATPSETPAPEAEAASPTEETTIYVTRGESLVEASNLTDALALAREESTSGEGVSPAANGVVKVALDPGHGGNDSGAVGVDGAYESNLNWKISNYCKQELDQYRGVETYLTRGENECPTIYERVKRAVDWGADVVISQHLNSFNHTAYGTEVYIPNDSAYNNYVHGEGERLGNAILDQLSALGLYRRGVKVRDLVYSTYPDGVSVEDYYGITRYAREFGITGIIVEHAFIDTESDYRNFLADDAKLRALGIGDAVGIANTYGLQLGEMWSWSPQVSAAVNVGQTAVDVTIAGGQTPSGVTGVAATFTGPEGTRRYEARRSGGDWTVSAPLRELHRAGDYTIEVSATGAGRERVVGSATVTVPRSASGSLRVVSTNAQEGTLTVEATVSATMGVESVHLPVWCDSVSGQDDLAWYTMEPRAVDERGNGTYTFTVDAFDHKLQSGEYEFNLYVTERNGVFSGLGSTRTTFTLPALSVKAEPSDDGQRYTISITGGALRSTTPVRFPTWSKVGDQDDLVWYDGFYDARQKAWTRVIDVHDHLSTGLFITDCYAWHKEQLYPLARVTYEVTSIRGNAEMTAFDEASGTVTVKANVFSQRGIADVSLPTWCESVGGQDDIVWASMTPSSVDPLGNGIYTLTFNLADHGGQTGVYAMHLYVTDRAGIQQLAAHLTETLGKVPDTPGDNPGGEPHPDGYPIMGASATNVDQMVRMYNASGSAYPAGVYASRGAETIRDFCSILAEEAAAEGVRAEVLFAQVVLETGWLQFGGDVHAEQCNFGGIGAVGGGAAGQTFPDVRTGLRAQVQHLKAYASTEPLRNACVDPRFSYVTRGCAPTVRDLTHRWATSDTYGDSLEDLIRRLAAA